MSSRTLLERLRAATAYCSPFVRAESDAERHPCVRQSYQLKFAADVWAAFRLGRRRDTVTCFGRVCAVSELAPAHAHSDMYRI
jgi:hypothetical protein